MSTLTQEKSTALSLLNFKSVSILTFWITSIYFFLCFFSWFGIVCFLMGIVYSLFIKDTPKGNFKALKASREMIAIKKDQIGFLEDIKAAQSAASSSAVSSGYLLIGCVVVVTAFVSLAIKFSKEKEEKEEKEAPQNLEVTPELIPITLKS